MVSGGGFLYILFSNIRSKGIVDLLFSLVRGMVIPKEVPSNGCENFRSFSGRNAAGTRFDLGGTGRTDSCNRQGRQPLGAWHRLSGHQYPGALGGRPRAEFVPADACRQRTGGAFGRNTGRLCDHVASRPHPVERSPQCPVLVDRCAGTPDNLFAARSGSDRLELDRQRTVARTNRINLACRPGVRRYQCLHPSTLARAGTRSSFCAAGDFFPCNAAASARQVSHVIRRRRICISPFLLLAYVTTSDNGIHHSNAKLKISSSFHKQKSRADNLSALLFWR